MPSRRDLLKAFSIIPLATDVGVMDVDGRLFSRTPNRDTLNAVFYIYGRMEYPFMALRGAVRLKDWPRVQALLDQEYAKLRVDLMRYCLGFTKEKYDREIAAFREQATILGEE